MIVYKFGCRHPSHADIAVIRDQLYRASRYRNQLIALEHARRAALHFGYTKEEVKAARSEESRALRAALVNAHGALGSGTYLLVERDVMRATKERNPRYRSCDETGRVGATIPTAREAKPIVGKWSGAFRMVHKYGPFYEAKISLGRGMSITLPVKAPRPLPDGAMIIGCTVNVDKVGDRWIYTLDVTMDVDAGTKPTGSGKCAVNFGWRRMPNGGVRVATCLGDDDKAYHLELPAELLGSAIHREKLRSLADYQAAAVLGDPRRRSRMRRKVLLDAAHRGPRRELSLIPFDVESDVPKDDPGRLEHWARRDRHLYQWERDAEAKFIRRRREIYRLWVRMLAKRYSSVMVEAFDLRKVLERAIIDELPTPEKRIADRANRLRFLVSPSSLRSELSRVFGEAAELVFAKAATKTCAGCGWRCKFDAAKHLEHTCERCGARFDQDVNNAANQLAASAAE